MRSYPFESKNIGTSAAPVGDRAVDDAFLREFIAGVYTNGIKSTPANGLQVVAKSGMTVTLKAGICLINGAIGVQTEDLDINLSASSSSLSRIDRIVIRFDTADDVRGINPQKLEGVPSTTPIAPEIHRASNYYEIVAADIMIAKGATEITNKDITDQRLNSSLCGMVVPAIPQPLTLDDLYSQYQSSLDQYLTLVDAAIDGTTAGNLQNQIGTLANLKTAEKANVVGAINELADKIYPVGSIYMSVNNTSPATLFGGTWEQVKDKFLLSAGDTYSAGSTGGESEHTLTIDEMPNHNHENSINWNKSSTIGTSGTAGLVIGSAQTITHFSVESAGGGQSHNNMPPYLAVYVWQRTA